MSKWRMAMTVDALLDVLREERQAKEVWKARFELKRREAWVSLVVGMTAYLIGLAFVLVR
jgi:hypothetical protein